MKHLFPEQSGSSDTQSPSSTQQLVDEHAELASELHYNANNIQKLKSRLYEVQKDRALSQSQRRELMAKLGDQYHEDLAEDEEQQEHA